MRGGMPRPLLRPSAWQCRRQYMMIMTVLLFLCVVDHTYAFDRERNTRQNGSKADISFLDDVFSGFYDFNDPTQSNGKSLMRRLWHHGRRRSVSVVEGVRGGHSYLLRGGADASIVRQRNLPSSTSLDLLAQSFALFLAWIVSLQATLAALISRRDSLFRLAARLVKSDTIAAVKTIQEILDSAHDHGVVDIFKKYPTQELIAAIYALSRLQAASEYHLGQIEKQQVHGPMKDFPKLHDDDLLEELCHYAPFASAAYGWKLDLATAGKFHRGDLHAVVKMTKIDPEDIIKVEWEARANRPAFYIARDKKKKTIVLSVRGTWSAHDLLTDLCCTPEEYFVSSRRHDAHYGMLAAARGVKDMAEDIISEALAGNPGYSLVLVGHSLGGSVAAVLGQMWSDTFRSVKVYAYGPACVAPMNDMNKNRIVSVMLEGDPFSSLSLGHVADISCALAHLCEDDDLRTTILTITDGPISEMDSDDIRWCHERMQEIRQRMTGEKLYPPGRLLFLSYPADKKSPPEIREIPPRVFDELRIRPQMFDLSRHVPRVYQRRLKSVLHESTGMHLGVS